MDLNRLYYLHQIALMRAAASENHGTRDHHHARADGFATHITAYQRRSGATVSPLVQALCW